MRKTKRNLTAAVLVFAATLSATPVFAAKEKEESTSKANTESISKEASAKDNGERTIIDHAGNEVTLPEEINRIVVTDTLPAAICIVTIFRQRRKACWNQSSQHECRKGRSSW